MDLTVAIVACGPQLEIALGGRRLLVPSVVRLGGMTPRSTLMLAAVDLLIEDSGADRADLARVVVTVGPGSFTGIRSGLATAEGLAAALGCEISAYDSLTAQAARTDLSSPVWAAQPGRRGEVYARRFSLAEGGYPAPLGEVQVLRVADLGERGPWVAAERLDLRGATRVAPVRSAAEALLRLAESGADSLPVEAVYVEGPPIHGGEPA